MRIRCFVIPGLAVAALLLGAPAVRAATDSAPAVDARALAAAVQAADPTVRPLGASTLSAREAATSFGAPLPDVLRAAHVRDVSILGFQAPCVDDPSGSALSALVITAGGAGRATTLVDALRSSAADGGDAFREASVSGRISPRITTVRHDGLHGFAVAITGNDSRGFVRDGGVVVVRRGTRVVVATALCSVAGLRGDAKEARVDAARARADQLATALLPAAAPAAAPG